MTIAEQLHPVFKKCTIDGKFCIDTYNKEYNNNLANFKAFRIHYAEKLNSTEKYIHIVFGRFKKGELECQKITDKKNYEVAGGKYHFKAFKDDKSDFSLSIDLVDEIFTKYSKHGHNYTTTDIVLDYDITPYQFNVLKNRLGLTKNSNIVSPHTFEQIPVHERAKYFEIRLEEFSAFNGKVLNKTFQKQKAKFYQKEVNKLHQKQFYYQYYLTEVLDNIGNAQSAELKTVHYPKSKVKYLHVYVADLHIGAKFNTLATQQHYDSNVVRSYLSLIADAVNSYKAENVVIHLLGDLIESFTGLNHDNTWMQLEYWGAEATINAYDILNGFFSKINNLKKLNCITGNHDRGSRSKSIDDKGEIGLLIYELIKRHLGENVDVQYSDLYISEQIGRFGFFDSHGDKRLTKKKGGEIALKYGLGALPYSFIANGHLHRYNVVEDEEKFTKFEVPSLVHSNYYAESLGLHSKNGYVMLLDKGVGIPSTIIERF